MNEPYFVSLFKREWILRCLIIVAVTITFTLFCVSTSEKIGRLSTIPDYDDSVYMLGAEFRNFRWQEGGWPALWKSFWELNLHSPYSECLAILAFALFGHNDRAPYLANAVVILAYLGCLTWLLRGLPFFLWLASLFTFLSLPIVKMGVVEFRPDIFWGICTAFGAIYVLMTPRLFKSGREALFSGIIFAAAYLVKPSTFALTTGILLTAFGGRLLHAWFAREEQEMTVRETARSLIMAGIALFTFAGWYYLLFGKQIWKYFYQNIFGIYKDIWSFKGSWMQEIFFYLNGWGAENTLGKLGEIIFFAMVVLLIWRFCIVSRTEKLRCLLLAGISIFIYTIITMGIKSPFLGAPLHMFIIFTTAYLFNSFYLQYSPLYKHLVTASMLIFAFIGAMFFQSWPEYSNWSKRIVRYTYSEATHSFINLLQSMEVFPKSILFVHSGPVIREVFQMKMFRSHQNPYCMTGAFCLSMEEFRARQKESEMIVIPDIDAKGTALCLPIAAILPDILKGLASDPEFSLYHTIRTADGSLVYVYKRNETMASKVEMETAVDE